MFSKSTAPRPTMIGWSSPSEVRPSAWRLRKMLKKARKRCQATPIVGCSEMVIIHANEMRIFTAATTTMTSSRRDTDQPLTIAPSQPVSG